MRTATVVGGGPAGLIAAEVLAGAGVAVTVYDRMPSVPRKFLLAGHGGLNITHSEGREPMLSRYGPSADRLAPVLAAFGPEELREWCAGLGEPTMVGSSGRVFPRSFRATPLARAWLARLTDLGVRLERRQRWTGWTDDGARLVLTADDGATTEVAGDVTVFALGGASWPRLGADGGWVEAFAERGVAVAPLRPANVGVRVAWSPDVAERFAGVPLKQVGLAVRGHGRPVRGDAMVTRTGLEGGPVYAIGAAIRDALDGEGCVLEVDLRPDLTAAQLADRLRRRRPKDSGSTWLRRSIGLDPVSIALLREAGGGALPTDAAAAAALAKAVPVTVTATMPIDRAISTAGGVAWSEVDGSLMLRRMPGTFLAGEMLDWEAPTGGYLLQASFSTGVVAARGALSWLEGRQVR
ncbi:NAD(FAD)-utilizing dehydrogenase [Actinotalea ferrariae CF5-4]|uniref:NAD(FAD)-utilizing dehydrogenase n=1 Tax=Actinotalea ferrariae CF5-4 TaxID=948458 RepID=A0A021VUX5_9CELL|nr:TIGR03862 family flavoprotein [Actinotalea ferrariae]EYR62857.1 NAD(FAD)-utilizing dehydrogenase [Actinotalea ferrariae CF5-4]